MNQFLIFARPRSRTAWVANFLTQATHSFCHHEGMADAANPIELAGRMRSNLAIAVGNSDTGMIHNPREILRFFPDARLVVLTGASLSWKRFAAQKEIDPKIVEMVDDAYQDTKKLLRDCAMFVDVRGLMRDTQVARVLWSHCTGRSATFDAPRYQMLRDLNIQVVQESLERRIASRLPRG